MRQMKPASICRTMKVSEAEILFVPGLGNSGPEHWQTRWQGRLSTARRVHQADWDRPAREPWVESVADAVNAAERPVVLVAHSLGVSAAILAVPAYRQKVAGAFFVAPPDVTDPNAEPASILGFGPYPEMPLPFPSMTVASRNDPYCSFAEAERLAAAWGSLLVDAGEIGHINAGSGHGPWPEGSMTFATFMSRL